jgi:hypothetical protein
VYDAELSWMTCGFDRDPYRETHDQARNAVHSNGENLGVTGGQSVD